MVPDNIPTVICWPVNDIDWSCENNRRSPPFTFNGEAYKLHLDVTGPVTSCEFMSPVDYRLPLKVYIKSKNPTNLSGFLLFYKDHSCKSELAGPYRFGPRTRAAKTKNEVPKMLDSVLFAGQCLPSSLVVRLVIYPKPLTYEVVCVLPMLHQSSPWLHLHDSDAPTAMPIRPSLFSAFDALDDGDITINLKDGTMKAHSLVLRHSAPGSYFAALLSLPMQEQQLGVITLEDVDCALFKEILRFIYTGHAYVMGPAERCAFSLAADRFQLTELARWARFVLQGGAFAPTGSPEEKCQIMKEYLNYPELEICQIQCLKAVLADESTLNDTPAWRELISTPGFAELMRDTLRKRRGFDDGRKRKREDEG
ncbi:hypothetical protein HDV00_003432 [Rhizophlyctis rosea]|nr:hypothetical protein HDV00_003432 [Rhizophlyctis rosea]